MVGPFYRGMLMDENGLTYGVKQIGNKPRVSAMPYLYDIAEGNVSDHDVLRVLGYNGDVGNAEEDVWDAGAGYAFPAAGGIQMEVVSGSEDDDGDPAGTGVNTVSIHYLDANYAEQTETVTLNGTTAVATTATDILRVNHFHSATVGSGGKAAGNISLRATADTPVYAQITAGNNNALSGVWTVPAGKTAYIVCWTIGAAGGNKDAKFILKATCSITGTLTSGIFQAIDIGVLEDAGVHIPFEVPVKVPATGDIKISVVSAAQSAKCSASFEGWYE